MGSTFGSDRSFRRKGLTGAACGPFMRSTCRDWQGPRLAASSQVIPSSVAARKLAAASAHSARAAPLAAHASRASSTSSGVSSFSWPCKAQHCYDALAHGMLSALHVAER